MPQSLMSPEEVAASLHVSPREVVRMAEKRILPGTKSRNGWRFHSGEIWNWIEQNLRGLPQRRERDKDPEARADLLLGDALHADGVVVDSAAKTKPSILRELADLAAAVDPYVDPTALAQALMDREAEASTALQDGVAVPHPARPFYSQGPVIAAARTRQGIGFGERGGGLTDLFFLICCPEQSRHLLYLGRLCRLLIDRELQSALREATDPVAFVSAIHAAESDLCAV